MPGRTAFGRLVPRWFDASVTATTRGRLDLGAHSADHRRDPASITGTPPSGTVGAPYHFTVTVTGAPTPTVTLNPGPQRTTTTTPTATSTTTPGTTTTWSAAGAGSGSPPSGSSAAAYPPLAATGMPVGQLVGAAAVLLVAGGVLLVFSRCRFSRRRRTTGWGGLSPAG